MNRRRIGLAALVVGAGAFVTRRIRRQVVPGPESDVSNHSPGSTVADHQQPTPEPARSDPTIAGRALSDPVMGSPTVADGVLADPVVGSPVIAADTGSAALMGSPVIAADTGSAALMGSPVIGSPVIAADTGSAALIGASLADPAATIVLPTMPQAGTPPQIPEAQAVQVDPAMASTQVPQPDSLASGPTPAMNTTHRVEAPDPSSPPPPLATSLAAYAAVDVQASKPPRHQRRGWQIFGGLAIGLLVAAFIAASAIRLPYYSLSPGAVYDTIDRVEAPGDLVSIPNGEIGFVTVAQTANITPWQWLDAKLDSNVRIRHEDEVQGDQTADELREADLRRMQISKNDAVIVALQRLGYDLEITPIGIEVAQVFDCTAADGTLGTGDLIVGVNGNDVRDGQQLIDQLAAASIGQEIELLIERIDPDNPTQSMRTDLVGITLGSADAACLPDDVRSEEPRPFIGIGTQTLVDENFPIDVDVRTGRVSGPSAGLAFTLAIIDVLSEGELTNGMSIVATGTINRDGQVGPVGGIHQKTVAAERSGADLFLVPLCCDNFVDSTTGEPLDLKSNYEEALLYAEDMKVVGVENLDDALLAIAELGGDVEQFLNQ